MANTKITNLTDGDPAASGDEIPVNRSGTDRKITVGSINAVATFLGLADTDDTTFANKQDAFVSVNTGETGLSFRYSTPEWEDVRDWVSSGPRELTTNEDITSAVSAIALNRAAGIGHGKNKIFIPRVHGTGSTANGTDGLTFDPQNCSGINQGETGNANYIFIIDTNTINLLSTWEPAAFHTIRGVNTQNGTPQFCRGPQPRPTIQAKSGAWTGNGADTTQPIIHFTQRNCALEDVSVNGNGQGALAAVKLGFDSHRLKGLFLSNSDGPALHIDSCFWVDLDQVSCKFTGTVVPDVSCSVLFSATSSNATGLVVGKGMTLASAGMRFESSTNYVSNIDLRDVLIEGMADECSMFTFDSSGGNFVSSIALTNVGIADPVGNNYLIENVGTKTFNVSLHGNPRSPITDTHNTGIFKPTLTNNIRGMFINEAYMQYNDDLGESYSEHYKGAAAKAFGLPRVDDVAGTSAKLYNAPLGLPKVIGTLLNVQQDPANWTGLGGGATITTGQTAPDGSLKAGLITGGGSGARFLSQSITPAVDDFILFGAWLKGNASTDPVSDLTLGVRMSTGAGWTLESEASPGWSPDPLNFAIPLPALANWYNIDDNGWQWVSYICKFSVVTGGLGTIQMGAGVNGGDVLVYNPCAMHIPASLGCDELTLMYYAQRMSGATGGILAAANSPASGDYAFPDLSDVFVKGDKVARQGLQTMWVPASAMTPRTTNGAAAASREINSLTLGVLAFDQTTSEGANFTVAFPKSWNAGTVTFRPHWTCASGTGTVSWTLSGGSFADNVAINVTGVGTGVTVTDTLQNVDRVHNGGTSTAVTLSNAAVDVPTIFLLVRTISDTLNADAELIGIEIFYTTSAGNDA